MDIVLLERIEKLGQMGDVVKVKPGFARNYLLPQKKALRATKTNLEHFQRQRVQLEAANLKRREEAEAVAARMQGLTLIMVRQAGESGQLYGSVAARDIADASKDSGFTIERSQVVLNQPIKTMGQHQVRVSLHPEVSVMITVSVARSLEEAQASSRTETREEPAAPADDSAAEAQE
ncbi:MAG: 50S ribosomal protein L9 [Alphaproteobacteria bacterium]